MNIMQKKVEHEVKTSTECVQFGNLTPRLNIYGSLSKKKEEGRLASNIFFFNWNCLISVQGIVCKT